MKFGSVISGLVELGVVSIKPASDAMGAMALPEPLICGPTMAMTLLSATHCLVLVAAWAGSYWPAATVASSLMSASSLILPPIPPLPLISSMAINAPSRMLAASAASAPVNGKLMPSFRLAVTAAAPAGAAAGAVVGLGAAAAGALVGAAAGAAGGALVAHAETISDTPASADSPKRTR